MKKYNSILVFLVTVFISMSLVACGTGTGSAEKGENKENAKKQETNMPAENKDLHGRAEKIATEVSKVQGVNKSYVVISEKTALIGVNINKDLEGKMTDELRKKVEDTVKNTDKDIERVALTADADLTERIKKTGEDIGAGKPISGLGTEIKEILNRIIPQ